jgi:hypothetical protein
MRFQLLLTPALAALMVACTTPAATPAPITDVPTLTPVETSETVDVVSVYLLGSQVTLGSEVEWGVEFTPTRMTFLRDGDGNVISTSYSPADSALVDVAEMRACIAWDEPCELPDEWSPFESLLARSEMATWHDDRQFWVAAEFRDSQGQPVPALNTNRATQTSFSIQDYGYVTALVNASTPVTMQPPLAQTALAITAIAFPVQGSVVLQDALCCAGGPANTVISIKATFEASSTEGEVTEMQLTGCGSSGDWEPLVPEKICQAQTTGNWTTFQLSVRYRDDQGNLSPVYTDDIAVEGMPPLPTP